MPTVEPTVENGLGLVRTSRPMPFAVGANRVAPSRLRGTTVHTIAPALSAWDFGVCRAADHLRLQIADCRKRSGRQNGCANCRRGKFAESGAHDQSCALFLFFENECWAAILSGGEPDRAGLGSMSRTEPLFFCDGWGYAGRYPVSPRTSPTCSLHGLACPFWRTEPAQCAGREEGGSTTQSGCTGRRLPVGRGRHGAVWQGSSVPCSMPCKKARARQTARQTARHAAGQSGCLLPLAVPILPDATLLSR
jgi:hypothetical protein